MRKMYAGILILALLLGAAVYNVHYLDGKMARLLEYVDTAQQLEQGGDRDGAQLMLRQAIEFWDGMSFYTHVFIRHSDIDSAMDAFYDCLGGLQSGEGSAAALEKLRAHLCSITDMEHISLGSIF
ncbi:MAG: DUF4363 family protein [Butyricicoccus sp.]|nr:DUF4363 family protein [Butyricicoccus sp.]